MSSRQPFFYIQEINCLHSYNITYITYSTIRLPSIMWVETRENDVAADKQIIEAQFTRS